MTITNPEQPLRLLIVEDSAFSRKLLEHALQNEPYNLLFAESGTRALELVLQDRPDIVITDWMLPDLTGPELCKRIRAEYKDGYVYLVLLTSNVEKDQIVEGLESGADDYVSKPFHQKELLARITAGRRIVGMQRVIQEKNRLLEHAARTDFLTDLPNRRAVEEYAHKQVKGGLRHNFPVWVLLADLNKFKSVNDQYGHPAGDEVLKRFAAILKKNTRASDICGRMGGDEFVIVATHVTQPNIFTFAERLRKEFIAERFDFNHESVDLSVSIGIAGFEAPELVDFEQLLARADAALYAAKTAGAIRLHETDRVHSD